MKHLFITIVALVVCIVSYTNDNTHSNTTTDNTSTSPSAVTQSDNPKLLPTSHIQYNGQ